MKIGQKVYGYCSGMFGRNFYGPARIEAMGFDWVVVRDESGEPWFAEGSNWIENLQDSQDNLNTWELEQKELDK